MKVAYLSSLASPLALCTYLENAGHTQFLELRTYLAQLANHPDGTGAKARAKPSPLAYEGAPNELSPLYPGDCRCNAACTGKFFIHKSDVTDAGLLNAAKASCR